MYYEIKNGDLYLVEKMGKRISRSREIFRAAVFCAFGILALIIVLVCRS